MEDPCSQGLAIPLIPGAILLLFKGHVDEEISGRYHVEQGLGIRASFDDNGHI